jgi:hypothetical protein
MHARIVRFTDVSKQSADRIVAEIEAGDGPPPGVESTAMKLLYDEDQSTAIFIAFFASSEAMDAADEFFDSMEPAETPGTRASVDRCEVIVDEKVG